MSDIRSIADLIPDARNANKGTERGRYMLEQSLREAGAGDVTLSDDYPACPGQTYIYILADPVTAQIRYVGKANAPYERLRAHYWGCGRGETHSQRWIAQLKSQGIWPVLGVIDMATKENWRAREKYWVAYFRGKGVPLTNIAAGGNGAPMTMPEETKAKMRKSCAGWHQPEEARRKISEARKGMVFPALHRMRLSQKKKEYFSDEQNTYNLSRYWAVLTDAKAREVRRLALTEKVSQSVIAQAYGVPQSTISEIKRGKRYKHAFAKKAHE